MPKGWKPPDTSRQVRALEHAKQALESNRQKMLAAQEQLEQSTKVYCGTIGALGLVADSPIHHVAKELLKEIVGHVACDTAITSIVDADVDAGKKLAANAKMIQTFDQEIQQLQSLSGATSSSVPGAAAPRPLASHAKLPEPLAALARSRKLALATTSKFVAALGKDNLAQAKKAAGTAASRLSALRPACTKARAYLKKVHLGASLTSGQMLTALGQLAADPQQLARAAQSLGITEAQENALVQAANGVDPNQVKATALPDLVCSSSLSAVDKSLAGSLRKLARAL